MPDARAKPLAAALPESGTEITRSASTGASRARISPIRPRTDWSVRPSSLVSGPREVDVLEHAQRGALGLDRDARLDAALAERDQLAGLHLAQQRGADDVQRAALRGDHVAVAELPEAERAHAGRVAEGDHAVARS